MLLWSLCETVSLGREATGKSGPYRPGIAMGVGDREREPLLCNRGELQTLNVEWQSRGAVAYQPTLAACVQFTNLFCNSSSRGSESEILSAKEVM